MIQQVRAGYRKVFRLLYTPDLRAQILGLVSFICLTRGIAYIQFRDLPAGLEVISRLIPIWIFAVLWLVVAGAGWIVAYRHLKGRGVTILQGTLFRLWGAGYATAWVLSGFGSMDWVAAAFYLAVAGIVSRIGRLEPGDD